MAAQVHRAFGAWAGGEGLRVRFEPDTTTAVDRLARTGVPLRRGPRPHPGGGMSAVASSSTSRTLALSLGEVRGESAEPWDQRRGGNGRTLAHTHECDPAGASAPQTLFR